MMVVIGSQVRRHRGKCNRITRKILSFFFVWVIILRFICGRFIRFTVAGRRDGVVVLITITFYGLLYKCDDCVTQQEDEIGYVDVRLNKFSFLVLALCLHVTTARPFRLSLHKILLSCFFFRFSPARVRVWANWLERTIYTRWNCWIRRTLEIVVLYVLAANVRTQQVVSSECDYINTTAEVSEHDASYSNVYCSLGHGCNAAAALPKQTNGERMNAANERRSRGRLSRSLKMPRALCTRFMYSSCARFSFSFVFDYFLHNEFTYTRFLHLPRLHFRVHLW